MLPQTSPKQNYTIINTSVKIRGKISFSCSVVAENTPPNATPTTATPRNATTTNATPTKLVVVDMEAAAVDMVVDAEAADMEVGICTQGVRTPN